VDLTEGLDTVMAKKGKISAPSGNGVPFLGDQTQFCGNSGAVMQARWLERSIH
jgi:hypothetical protein